MLFRFESIQKYFQLIFLTSLLCVTIYPFSFGQLRIDKVSPPSFNAAALIKYCDHPLGTKYGIPKTKISIKTLINNDLYIPISLSYHSIGIKVEEEPTWAGLGWYLNAGGLITRIIRGENDFGVSENELESEALGYPFEHIKPCFDDCEENENADFHQKVCDGKIDSDPDIFFYDILGNKGKFLLTPDHDANKEYIEIKIVRPRPMTIKFYIQENYWVAEGQNGFIYTFKAREITETYANYYDYQRESHNLHYMNHYDKATSSWYLTEVVSAQGARASFIYDVAFDGKSKFASNSTYHKMNINDDDVWDLHYSSYCFPDAMENVQIVTENQHKNLYLKSIQSGEYRVTFTKSQQDNITTSQSSGRTEINGKNPPAIKEGLGPQKIDKIVITKGGEVVSTNDFEYSYFNDEVYGEEAYLYQRLRLDGLTNTSKTRTKTYKFTYEEEVSLPSKQSHARDLWGYYNGEEDFYNITPSDFFNYSQPEKLLQEEGKTKHYSLEYMQAGILKMIDYGKGRTKKFAYDHQEFEDIDEEISSHFTKNMRNSNFSHHINPFIFGGLRIKEIIDTYPTEKIYKDFNYKPLGKETGKLIIMQYNHAHHGYGHKTSGNHSVKYSKVKIRTGKLFRGTKF